MEVYSFCHKGKRKYQEDAIYISMDQKMFVICDGVGGSPNGEAASNIVINSISKDYDINKGSKDFKVENLISNGRIKLDEFVNEFPLNFGMATTIASLFIDRNTAKIFHAGDSRVYYIDMLTKNWWVTKDHSVTQELFDSGIIKTEIEMKKHPMNNRITNALMANNNNVLSKMKLDENSVENIKSGDFFLLASDGALENYTSTMLVKHFTDEQKTLKIKWNEFERICSTKSDDNNSCILIKI